MEKVLKKIIVAVISFFALYFVDVMNSEASTVDMITNQIESFTDITFLDPIRAGLLGASAAVLMFFKPNERSGQIKKYGLNPNVIRKIFAAVLFVLSVFVKMESQGDWLNITICVLSGILLLFLIFYKGKSSNQDRI